MRGLLLVVTLAYAGGDEAAAPVDGKVVGALVEADIIHRSGQFRAADTGAIVDFALLPAAPILYLGTEGDLRDVPIGTTCEFWLRPVVQGEVTRVSRMSDLATNRVEGLEAEQQRQRHDAFLRVRGLAAVIDRVEGKRLIVDLLGDPASLRGLCQREGIDPARWAADRRNVHTVVANEELRTYNPHVDGQRSTVVGYESTPTDAYGRSGIRWVIEPSLMLEGFRKGRYVRLFAHPGWPVADMPFGETLYSEAPGVKPALEEPLHYPYRTDFANGHLPWYRPKPGAFPPLNSHHLVAGELLSADPDGRSGRFRADKIGSIVDFTLPPYGGVMYAGAEADLRDVPTGTRCLFSLHQDDGGTFTRATAIVDEATEMARAECSYRLDRVALGEGKILVARRHDRVKDDKEALIQPPDFGRSELAVDASTRVWKGGGRVGLDALVDGDSLLIDRSGQTATSRGVCVDIWAGTEASQLAAQRQQDRHDESLLREGVPGWIEAVEGKTMIVTFFCASRRALRSMMDTHKGGDRVRVWRVDDRLRPLDGPPVELRHTDERWEGPHAPRMGSSGTRWTMEGEGVDGRYQPGSIVRVARVGWPTH